MVLQFIFVTFLAYIGLFSTKLENKPYVGTYSTHPMHLCVTEMNFNQAGKALEISHKIFYDDLEEAIFASTKQKLALHTPQENPKSAEYIQNYLRTKFEVTCNQKKQTINFVGSEYENSAIWVHYEIVNVGNLQTLEIKNTILLDLFDDQNNFLHFKKGEFRKSWRFNLDNVIQQWEF
jgi:hypothetical protein